MKITANIMVDYFIKNKIDEKNMHCIGFSLGFISLNMNCF